MTERDVIEAVIANKPFEGMPGIRTSKFSMGAEKPFDLSFQLESGSTTITVFAEVKTTCSPKTVTQIGDWLKRMKALKPEAAFALICPITSPETQAICMETGIDLIDLAGNIVLNVPGKLVLQRVGRKASGLFPGTPIRNPFGGKASRVLRVLLQDLKDLRTTDIVAELDRQSRANTEFGNFSISFASASKTLNALEEEVLVRRRGNSYYVPDPRRLLFRWADRYRERSKFDLRSSFKIPNIFGSDLSIIAEKLKGRFPPGVKFMFTGAAAATVSSPFVDIDRIDLFVSDSRAAGGLREAAGFERGPEIRVISPYDAGVFLYGRNDEPVPRVSDLQIFLDLYVRGGRDLKQAEYLLSTNIEATWRQSASLS